MANATVGKIHLESIDRIGSIPLIESSFKHAEQMYGKVKGTNRLFNWYFETAEATLFAAFETFQPAVKLFEAPLKQLDSVMCKSLDILEQRIPLVYLPPEMMYWNTKEYMSDRLVRPVVKRADSVKQLGNAVLESTITTYAANRIDGAFTVADKYVDKYLMMDGVGGGDQVDGVTHGEDNIGSEGEKGAIKAIHHGQRFSRKLKRRLTQRTLAEARALKKQSKEAINIIIYAAELIATDPKLALQKAKELWDYLSKDEPENQARPTSLEQLMVLLSRESARRVVHLVNYSASMTTNVSRTVAHSMTEVVHLLVHMSDQVLKRAKLDKVKNMTKIDTVFKRGLSFYGNLQGMTNEYLERVAVFLSGRIEAEKVVGSSPQDPITTNAARRRIEGQENNSSTAHNNINGVY